jgi:hypothetical protein
VIFHFDFGNYRRMFRLAWREPNPRARRYYLAVLILVVPIVSSFHALCFLLDGVLFPRLRRVEVRAPVFVVGHARSGTTLLHRLMSLDRGRFCSFRLYELYFPSLLQKKLIRAVASFDERRLGGALERRVRAWEERRYGSIRKVHEMGLTEPEEDDLVFYYSCATGFWITKMPYMGDLDFYYVDRWPARRRRRLLRFYRDCIRRQLYLDGEAKVYLSKSPIFAGRVESLIEAFPDSRFVVPLRNPYETIPSLLKLMRMGWRRLDWDEERQRRCLAILADQSFETYRHPLEVLERHPSVPRAIVDYRDAVEDPAGTIEAVYGELGIPITQAYRDSLREQGGRAKRHVSGHAYSLEEFGLQANEIHERLGDLFERYGWEAEAPGGEAGGAGGRG